MVQFFVCYKGGDECTLPPSFTCSWCSFLVLQRGWPVQFLGVSMPLMNALFLLIIDVHGAVFKCFKGVDRCSFWEFLCRSLIYSSSSFYMFMVQFFSASKGESGAVFGSFYAVHECTLPLSLRHSWCSFFLFHRGRAVQFLWFSMSFMNALFLLL